MDAESCAIQSRYLLRCCSELHAHHHHRHLEPIHPGRVGHTHDSDLFHRDECRHNTHRCKHWCLSEAEAGVHHFRLDGGLLNAVTNLKTELTCMATHYTQDWWSVVLGRETSLMYHVPCVCWLDAGVGHPGLSAFCPQLSLHQHSGTAHLALASFCWSDKGSSGLLSNARC